MTDCWNHLNRMNNKGEERVIQDEGRNNKNWCSVYKCLAIGSCVFTVIVVLAMVFTSLDLSIRNKIQLTQTRDISQISTYDRIGNKQCPDVPGTSLVYYGFTAGFQAATSATTFSCLPLSVEHISYYDPAESQYTNSSQVQFVNVTEYRTFIPNRNNYASYCALCKVEGRNTIQILPATDTCIDSSWTKEYNGYLMTDNLATTFTCVDKKMQPVTGTREPGDTAPKLRHVAVPHHLGEGLPNEYQPNKVLSCVVCSK